MNFAERMKHEREKRELNTEEMGDLFGVSHSTVQGWENGRYPQMPHFYQIVEVLEWSDDTFMRYMQEYDEARGRDYPPEYSKALSRSRLLRLTKPEFAQVLGVTYDTLVQRWERRLTTGARKRIAEFMEMSDDGVHNIVGTLYPKERESEEPKGPRIDIDYELIYEIEDANGGSLSKVSDDDPLLKELQAKMNGVEK